MNLLVDILIIAGELEKGFGDELISKYAPGAVVAGSRTVPWTWRNFGAFRGYAEAATLGVMREGSAKRGSARQALGTSAGTPQAASAAAIRRLVRSRASGPS